MTDLVLYNGNYIVIRYNGSRRTVTDAELQQLLDNGEDVEVVTPT